MLSTDSFFFGARGAHSLYLRSRTPPKKKTQKKTNIRQGGRHRASWDTRVYCTCNLANLHLLVIFFFFFYTLNGIKKKKLSFQFCFLLLDKTCFEDETHTGTSQCLQKNKKVLDRQGTQQHRPESPTVTLAWQASNCNTFTTKQLGTSKFSPKRTKIHGRGAVRMLSSLKQNSATRRAPQSIENLRRHPEHPLADDTNFHAKH